MGFSRYFSIFSLAGAGLIIAAVFNAPPQLWAGETTQVLGLSLLPVFLPLVLSALGYPVGYQAAQTLIMITFWWLLLIRWSAFMPILVLSDTSILGLALPIVTVIIAGYWIGWKVSRRSLFTLGESLDEMELRVVLGPVASPPAFSISMVAGAWSRLMGLDGFGLLPVLMGYSLLTTKPLWIAGLASLASWAYVNFLDSSRQFYLTSVIKGKILWLFLVPVILYLIRCICQRINQPHQLSLEYDQAQEGSALITLGAAAFVLVSFIAKPELTLLTAVYGLLAFFYTSTALVSVGLLAFPATWCLFWAEGSQSVFLVYGMLGGFSATFALLRDRMKRRESLTVGPGWSGVTIALTLLLGMLILAWPGLQDGLGTFPSLVGDWLGRITRQQFPPFIWFGFILFTCMGMLTERIVYMYLAWGLFIPAEWGFSLLIGSILGKLVTKADGRGVSAAQGLITGDIIVSLLLLFGAGARVIGG